jgi:predicted nuclease of predicted toxin-antitoxin system
LAVRLVGALAELYPGSVHISDVGLLGAADISIWQHAGANGFVLVSKDEDFHRLSVLSGPPPKVIWLRMGNCSTEQIIELLREMRDEIQAFLQHEEAGFLALGSEGKG